MHIRLKKKTGIPGHHWPPPVFSIFALAAEPKAISWRFLSYIIRADEKEHKENPELPKTEGRGRLWGNKLENVEARPIDMVRKTVLSKMLNFLLNFYSLAFQCHSLQKIWKALLQDNLQSSGYFLLLVFDFNPKPSTCKMNISSVTMIWIGPSKWQSPLFVCEISRGTNTYVTKSRLMFFAVVYSL